MTTEYYRVRSTSTRVNIATGVLKLEPLHELSDALQALQQHAGHDPLTSKLEHQLLGVGAPTIPARTRLFHTMEQARSYMDGWNGIIHDTRSLLDFSMEGYLDRDKYDDNKYDREPV